MQHDVRRSDQTDATARTEPEPAPKSAGFARSLFRLGGKRKAAPPPEPARLQNRLKEVLERDRALIASEPPAPEREVVELAHDDVEMHDDDAWSEQTDPFGDADPEAHTGTRPALEPEEPEADEWPVPARWDHASALDEPFSAPATGTRPSERGVLQLAEARESADLRFSQIASWIEEEISEFPDGAGPLALEAPLDEHEAAELDAVLGGVDSRGLSAREHGEEPPTLSAAARVAPTTAEPPIEPAREPVTEMHGRVDEPSEAVAEAAKRRPATPASRAQVKAKVSARPAPRDDAPSGSKEPINTLTMARLLAMQGYKPRALAVYRELLKRTPDDEVLRAEYEALKKAEAPA